MKSSVKIALCAGFAAIGVGACSQAITPSTPKFIAKREPWRAQEEQACLSSGAVRETYYRQSRSALGGPSVCGAARPFSVAGAAGGRVSLKPAALLRCPMIPQVDRWVERVVLPASRRYLGSPVVELKVAASYACRPINHKRGARLSEHGYANALDVSAFVLADGRKITVLRSWRNAGQETAFLRAIHRGACDNFTTVLGPFYDRHHRDHFHLDLAHRGSDGLRGVCK